MAQKRCEHENRCDGLVAGSVVRCQNVLLLARGSPMMLVVRRTPPVDLPAPHPSPPHHHHPTTTTHPAQYQPPPPPTPPRPSILASLPPGLCPRSRTPTAGRGARLKWRGRRGIAREKEESRATSGSCALDSRRCWGTMVTPPTPPRRPSACAENWRRPSKRTPSATTRSNNTVSIRYQYVPARRRAGAAVACVTSHRRLQSAVGDDRSSVHLPSTTAPAAIIFLGAGRRRSAVLI